MHPVFFIFGFGYTAQCLAVKLHALGFEVAGTTRCQEKILDANLKGQLLDFAAMDIEKYLAQATHILVCIPPVAAGGDCVLTKYGSLLAHYSSNIQWLGYLSSTGVYGNYDGQWVDERSPCIPQSGHGRLRLNAEKDWIQFAEKNQLPLQIFRLAGIYGPGRSALERIRAGKPYSIFKKGQVFSRIHVEDIVSILIASMHAISPFSMYNVADDEPAPSHLVDAYAAYLLHQPPLPLLAVEKAGLSPMEKEFYANNRRVSNSKIKQELQVTLQYPTFREGLQQVLAFMLRNKSVQ
ncbi:SDR family oxidoreductase [Legionella septentrionalis]|uniref:SDR family oxidoreductase n=1 Tax=Legionella septentrionalis TaxID=2498109 RepID=UPI000F8CC949|nr:SDR family oxidoreductase [Legionella septentrionalis]RUQ94646.1 SDR family oxidoreductase [Legionella septentrionalis]